MERKKILIIHSSLAGGGAEKVLIDILKNFDYATYDVTLFLLKRTGVYLQSIPSDVNVMKEGIPVFPRWCNKVMILTNLYGICLKSRVRKIFKNYRYDTIISFMEGPAAKCHSYLINKASRNVSWIHTNLKVNHWSRMFFPLYGEEKRFYKRINEIIIVSGEAKEAFNNIFHLNKGSVICNLIDRKAINIRAAELLPQKSKFTICNVGRLISSKRQDKIIDIALILRESGYDVDFWIIGQGELKDKLVKMAKQKNVEDMIHFLGFQENPYSYINASDLFLLVSDNEGFSLVVAEALCLGKPVISTNITGPTEQLENGKYGILTSFDVNEIAEVIKKLIDNPSLLQDYAKKANYRGKALFDVEKVMLQIYDAI